MRIGAVDYFFRRSEAECFYLAREMGLDCIELAEDADVDEGARLLFRPPGDGIRRISAATGVGLASVYAMHCLKEDLLAPHSSDRWQERMRPLAQAAAGQGAEVLTVPLFGASRPNNSRALRALQERLTTMISWEECASLRFAVQSLLPAVDLRAVLEAVGDERVGVSFHPACLAAAGRDPLEEWNELEDRVRQLRVAGRYLGRPLAPPLAGVHQEIARRFSQRPRGGTLIVESIAAGVGLEGLRRFVAEHRMQTAA